MSIDGSTRELVAFILLAIGFFGMIFYAAYKRSTSNSILKSLLSIAVLAAFCFVGFKAGFVRHDLHSLIAWGVLALASAAYAALENWNAVRWPAMALSVTCAITALEVLHSQTGIGTFAIVQDRLRDARDSLSSLSEFVHNPDDWLRIQRIAMERGR